MNLRELLFGMATAFGSVGVMLSSDLATASAQFAAPEWKVTRQVVVDGNRADLVPINFLGVDASGNIVVGQPQDHRLLLFDPSGKPRATLGRMGRGPGEFAYPSAAGVIGDSLWAYDSQLRRTTIFSPGLKFVRSYTMVSAPAPPAAGEPSGPLPSRGRSRCTRMGRCSCSRRHRWRDHGPGSRQAAGSCD